MSNMLYIANGRSFYSSNPPRKIEKVVESFRELGHDVQFICGGDLLGDAPRSSSLLVSSSRKNQSVVGAFIQNSASEYRDSKHDKRLLSTLEQRYGNSNIDLVWERSSRLHVAGLRFAKERNIPYVMEWKDNLVQYNHSLFRKLALSQEQEKMKSATAIVVESHMLARQIAEEEGVVPNKFKVAFNAVDAEQFYCPQRRNSMREGLGLAEDDFVVGYVGSYAFYHGVEILCDTVKCLIEAGKSDKIKFVLVGDGSGRQLFEKRAQALGVQEFFNVVGRVDKDEVPAYLSAFDCAILPDSTDIICPVKVQEYMAAELPVLLPDYEANQEIITQEEDGVLFEAQNTQAIASAIIRLNEDRGFALGLGKRAREVVTKELSWISTWGAALDEVLQEHVNNTSTK